jgi:hypothetical protein
MILGTSFSFQTMLASIGGHRRQSRSRAAEEGVKVLSQFHELAAVPLLGESRGEDRRPQRAR